MSSETLNKGWVNITNENDYPDTEVYQRKFSGRLTKKRYKILDIYTRKNSWRQRCHHEHDCCGCIFKQSMYFQYAQNQVTITMQLHRNL